MEIPYNHPIKLVIQGWRHEVYDKDSKMLFKVMPMNSDRHHLRALSEQLTFMTEAVNERCRALEAMENVEGLPGVSGPTKKKKGGK